jgi:hypothetical protein
MSFCGQVGMYFLTVRGETRSPSFQEQFVGNALFAPELIL